MSLTGAASTIFGGRQHAYLSDGIDDILFNVVTSENITDQNDLSIHAIEDGADVTDHIISKPRTFALDIILSDETIDLTDPVASLSKFTGSIKDRQEILEGWLKDKPLLTYYTFDDDIEDVAIQSLSRRRSLDTGNGIGLNLTLSHVNIAKSQTTNVKIKQAPKPQAKNSKTENKLASKAKEISNGKAQGIKFF